MTGGKILECVVIQYPGNCVAHSAHDLLHRAMRLVGVGAFAALLIGRFADTADRSEWAVQYADDLTERDVLGVFDETVSSLDPSAAGEEAGSLEGKEDLLQELNRNVLTSGNVVTLQRGRSVNHREFEQGSKSVFAFLGEIHRRYRLKYELVCQER